MGSLIIVILNWACNLTKIKSFYSNLLKNIWQKIYFFRFLIVRAIQTLMGVKDFGQNPTNFTLFSADSRLSFMECSEASLITFPLFQD